MTESNFWIVFARPSTAPSWWTNQAWRREQRARFFLCTANLYKDVPYLKPIIEEIEKEVKERADLESLTVQKRSWFCTTFLVMELVLSQRAVYRSCNLHNGWIRECFHRLDSDPDTQSPWTKVVMIGHPHHSTLEAFNKNSALEIQCLKFAIAILYHLSIRFWIDWSVAGYSAHSVITSEPKDSLQAADSPVNTRWKTKFFCSFASFPQPFGVALPGVL